MRMLKRKQTNMLLAIAAAGTAAYFVRTFPGGDTIIGGLIGAAFGHPWAGAVTGLLVPSARSGRTFDILAPPEAAGPSEPPATTPAGATTS
jgi:hypothetical protein